VLSELLVLLHPLMPHLTEELWHGLRGDANNPQADGGAGCGFLALQPWPQAQGTNLDEAIETSFNRVIEAIRLARNLRAVAGLKPAQKAPVKIVIDAPAVADVFRAASEDIATLAKASTVIVALDDQDFKGGRCLAGVSGGLQVLLPLEGLVDLESLRGRLEKDLAKAEKDMAGLKARLSNPNFSDKAPAAVVAECRANLSEAETQAALARKRLADLA